MGFIFLQALRLLLSASASLNALKDWLLCQVSGFVARGY